MEKSLCCNQTEQIRTQEFALLQLSGGSYMLFPTKIYKYVFTKFCYIDKFYNKMFQLNEAKF